MVSFPTTHSLFNNEETSDKHKLRDFLQKNWSVLFKSVKVIKTRKDKEIVMDWRRLKRHSKCNLRFQIGSWDRKRTFLKTSEI